MGYRQNHSVGNQLRALRLCRGKINKYAYEIAHGRGGGWTLFCTTEGELSQRFIIAARIVEQEAKLLVRLKYNGRWVQPTQVWLQRGETRISLYPPEEETPQREPSREEVVG